MTFNFLEKLPSRIPSHKKAQFFWYGKSVMWGVCVCQAPTSKFSSFEVNGIEFQKQFQASQYDNILSAHTGVGLEFRDTA